MKRATKETVLSTIIKDMNEDEINELYNFVVRDKERIKKKRNTRKFPVTFHGKTYPSLKYLIVDVCGMTQAEYDQISYRRRVHKENLESLLPIFKLEQKTLPPKQESISMPWGSHQR